MSRSLWKLARVVHKKNQKKKKYDARISILHRRGFRVRAANPPPQLRRARRFFFDREPVVDVTANDVRRFIQTATKRFAAARTAAADSGWSLTYLHAAAA